MAQKNCRSTTPTCSSGTSTPRTQWGTDVVDTKSETGINGGISGTNGGPNMVSFYVEVEDIQAKLEQAQELGGSLVVPVTTIPGMVTFAMFTDPEGNCIGLVSSETPG